MKPSPELELLQYLTPKNAELAAENPVVLEEFAVKRGDVSFYLLVNRRHRNMRVVDYRIGSYQLKRAALDRLARDRGLRKIFTLVEKQDSNSWRTVGFSREAVVPVYFRTADAYVMSRVYNEEGEPLTGGLSKVAVEHPVPEPKRPRKPTGLKLSLVTDPAKLAKLVARPEKVPFYAPYGKGSVGPEVGVSATVNRKRFWIVAETNEAFGHAKVDLLGSPSSVREVYACVFALQKLVEYLEEQNMAGAFAFVPVDDELHNLVFASAGCRHTGQLTRHVVFEEGEPLDMHVWHYRIRSRGS